ncbi:YidB family protein [Iodobacter sp. CM08]|nr:YidB family protein [Iodobacter sp. CM08]MDW5415540.1 YidB family protein [Iodobacter sp. CM08]
MVFPSSLLGVHRMGLIDQLAGQLLGGKELPDGLVQSLSGLLEQQGGISGLVEKFQNGGLADIVQSWVGTGDNLPVSSEQIEAVLGGDAIGSVAEKLGVNPSDAAAKISEYLPQIINQLTPNGEVPEGSGNLLSAGLDMLKGKLFG